MQLFTDLMSLYPLCRLPIAYCSSVVYELQPYVLHSIQNAEQSQQSLAYNNRHASG